VTRRATLSREEARRVLAAHVRDLALGVGVPDPVREAELRRIIDGPAAGDIGPQQVVVRGARAPEVRVQEREPGADIEEVVDTRRRVPLWREGEGGELVPLDPHAARAAIAGAILAIRGADGAPVLYSVARGLGKVVTQPGQSPKIVAVVDAAELRITVDEYLSIGVLKPTKDGAKQSWSNDDPLVTRRLEELSRPSAWAAVRVSPPELATVRAYPYFNRLGKLVNEVGYDPASKCYLTRATEIQRPAPGETPLTVLAEWMTDFMRRSFGAAHDMTYAMALAITVLCRDMIAGPTPLFTITAAAQGTGKGKLADAIARAVVGDVAWTVNYAEDGDRLVSEIITALSSGAPMIMLDNVRRRLGGEALETVTTRMRYQGRVLGTTDPIDLPNLAVWLATANNITTTPDMDRRKVEIRLVSREEVASRRGGWTHDDIDAPGGWTDQNRPRILGAFVAIVERHLEAKAQGWVPPVPVWRPGSYEAWASVVGEAVTHAGMPGWGQGVDVSSAAADPETLAYRAVAERVAGLHFERYGNADTARLEVRGAQIGPIVADVEHWAHLTDGKRDTALSRQAWALLRSAAGRTWEFAADGKRMAGTLTFTEIVTVNGAKVGAFSWRVRE
jgi:hypothetical protein